MPHSFSRSTIKFQGHMGRKISNVRFRIGIPVWIHRWLCNDAQHLKWHWRCVLFLSGVIHQIWRSHNTNKYWQLWPEMSLWTVTKVWIYQWLWNNVEVIKVKTNVALIWAFLDCNSSLNPHAQSFHWHRRGTILFFEVIYPISRSQGLTNQRFWPKLSVYGLQRQIQIAYGYKTMHKALSGTDEEPYYISKVICQIWRSRGQINANFDPNSVFPDSNSRLNPLMALKLCTKLEVVQKWSPIVFRRSVKF